MTKKYAYVIEDDPQLSVWDTLTAAEQGRKDCEGSRTSDVFEFDEPTTPEDAYNLADAVLHAYTTIGY